MIYFLVNKSERALSSASQARRTPSLCAASIALPAAAGHQALPAEAEAASRPAPLPLAPHSLALRASKGRHIGGRGEGGCWKPDRAEKQLLPSFPPIPSLWLPALTLLHQTP